LVEHLLLEKAGQWGFRFIFRLGYGGQRKRFLPGCFEKACRQGAEIRTTSFPDRLVAGIWGAGLPGLRTFLTSACDVVLAPTTIVPRVRHAKVGWFVYDMTPLKIPRFFKGSAAAFNKQARRCARRADFIVALSECTKRDIIELVEYPAEKITVVYPGAGDSSSVRRPPGATGPGRPTILYLGALALNKNVDGLLRIFARCVHDHRLDIDLVLTGTDFCGAAYWAGLVQRLGIERRVRFLGWVSETEREALLSRATMLWQFSWYEGFGLPVLEAAGRGVPVLCTDRGAVPEILRSPDQEVDPADEAGAAARAAEALKSPAILQAWREHGLKRAAEFTWARAARRLAGAIEAQIA
jgi:glycosyltransferase involved in cell wall biosynthesis